MLLTASFRQDLVMIFILTAELWITSDAQCLQSNVASNQVVDQLNRVFERI